MEPSKNQDCSIHFGALACGMNDWPHLITRFLDIVLDRTWLLEPMLYILFIVSGAVLIWGDIPAGWHWLGISICGCTGLFAPFASYHRISENKRIRKRLLNIRDNERLQFNSFIEGQETTNLWPHDPCIAALHADGVVESLPCEIGNGMRTYKLTRRAKRLIEKGFYD